MSSKRCPTAEAVYELFHTVARFSFDVVARVGGNQAMPCANSPPLAWSSSAAAGFCCVIGANSRTNGPYDSMNCWSLGQREPTRPTHAVRQVPQKFVFGILASALYLMNSFILEGVSNRIKVIKRMAYGFSDSAYSFQKIKAVF